MVHPLHRRVIEEEFGNLLLASHVPRQTRLKLGEDQPGCREVGAVQALGLLPQVIQPRVIVAVVFHALGCGRSCAPVHTLRL
jgi:hypothetical protein